MKTSLTGKVALVAGATRGAGRGSDRMQVRQRAIRGVQHRSQPTVAARVGRYPASMRDRPHDRQRQRAARTTLYPRDFRNRGWCLKNQLRRHDNRRSQTAIDGTFVRENAVDASRGFPIGLFSLQLQSNMDAPDDQYVFLKFNFTYCFGYEAIIRGIYVTRFQRASEGAGKSTSGGRDDVIERRGVRFQNAWRNLVVLSDSPVDSEYHRRYFCRQVCFSNRSLHPFDSNFGTIDNLGHRCSFLLRCSSPSRRATCEAFYCSRESVRV